MPGQVRQIIGVIAAEANNIEQRQIIKGVIGEAQARNLTTVVLSNVYNPYDYDYALRLENDIYKLIFSPQLSGLILVEESFINETIRQILRNLLSKRQDLPVVSIGIYIEELDFGNVHFINTDDKEDMKFIMRHLMDDHGMRKIDILTGFEGNMAAENRVAGYREVLEEHGVEFDPARVHYGDFWFSSGEALAKRYVSGELPLPEAVFCTSDHMAFGLLDVFLKNGIRVPEDVAVTGYEYVHERIYHSPLLSTYQRARTDMGKRAVRMLCRLMSGDEPDFTPPAGIWVPGQSCGCAADPAQLHAELELMRSKQQYEKWNVLGTLEQQLTLCSSLDEFISVLGKHNYWVRWVQNMFLCLFENWYDTDSDTPSGLLTCRSVMPWNDWQQPVTCDRYDFSALYAYSPETSAHFYLPLFFEKHFFGYYVLEYHAPDAYDDVFRNWMKSISIALNFLCMKNDIRYLLQCQNLSEQHDSLTGLYNKRGFESALSARCAADSEPIYVIALKLGVLQNDLSPETQATMSGLMQKTAEVLRTVGTQGSVCGRVSSQTFLCAGFPCDSDEHCERVCGKLRAVMIHQAGLTESIGMESMLVSSCRIGGDITPERVTQHLESLLDENTAVLAAQKKLPHAGILFTVRNQLYSTGTLSADIICKKYVFSAGYFRQIYRDCFQISFHQDVINARVFHAIYLLTTTVLSISSIAEQCGYEDCNYFLRQFQKVTGMTPGQYRRQI